MKNEMKSRNRNANLSSVKIAYYEDSKLCRIGSEIPVCDLKTVKTTIPEAKFVINTFNFNFNYPVTMGVTSLAVGLVGQQMWKGRFWEAEVNSIKVNYKSGSHPSDCCIYYVLPESQYQFRQVTASDAGEIHYKISKNEERGWPESGEQRRDCKLVLDLEPGALTAGADEFKFLELVTKENGNGSFEAWVKNYPGEAAPIPENESTPVDFIYIKEQLVVDSRNILCRATWGGKEVAVQIASVHRDHGWKSGGRYKFGRSCKTAPPPGTVEMFAYGDLRCFRDDKEEVELFSVTVVGIWSPDVPPCARPNSEYESEEERRNRIISQVNKLTKHKREKKLSGKELNRIQRNCKLVTVLDREAVGSSSLSKAESEFLGEVHNCPLPVHTSSSTGKIFPIPACEPERDVITIKGQLGHRKLDYGGMLCFGDWCGVDVVLSIEYEGERNPDHRRDELEMLAMKLEEGYCGIDGVEILARGYAHVEIPSELHPSNTHFSYRVTIMRALKKRNPDKSHYETPMSLHVGGQFLMGVLDRMDFNACQTLDPAVLKQEVSRKLEFGIVQAVITAESEYIMALKNLFDPDNGKFKLHEKVADPLVELVLAVFKCLKGIYTRQGDDIVADCGRPGFVGNGFTRSELFKAVFCTLIKVNDLPALYFLEEHFGICHCDKDHLTNLGRKLQAEYGGCEQVVQDLENKLRTMDLRVNYRKLVVKFSESHADFSGRSLRFHVTMATSEPSEGGHGVVELREVRDSEQSSEAELQECIDDNSSVKQLKDFILMRNSELTFYIQYFKYYRI